jgi:hypothetical protein
MKRRKFLKLSVGSSIIASTGFIETAVASIGKKDHINSHKFFCSTCGTQFTNAIYITKDCPICDNDRQFIPPNGQSWTKWNDLNINYSNNINELVPNLFEIRTSPRFALGQKAFLIITPNGNVLWDCVSLLNESTIEFIKSKGGLKAIIISHPHFNASMSDWAEAFECPIYIHQNDQEFILSKSKYIQLWNGDEKELWDQMKIKLIGGHFPGSCILIVPFLSKGDTILCSDTFWIAKNNKYVSVMYSFPNYIPVKISEIQRIKRVMKEVQFDQLIGSFDNQLLNANAKEILHASFDNYF